MLEHLHGIGERLLAVGAELLVHGIARRRRAEMRQAGAGQMQVRRVGMIDRRNQPALPVGGLQIDSLAEAFALDQRDKADPAPGPPPAPANRRSWRR